VRQAVDSEPPRPPSPAPHVDDIERPRRHRRVERPEATSPPRRTAIYGIQGLGAPVGVFGLEAVQRLGALFEVAVGVGLGGSAMESQKNASLGHLLQWSFMPRLRAGDDHNAVTFGAGVSGGQYGGINLFGFGPGCTSDDLPCGDFPTHYTLWTNVELGGEHWTRHGVAFRYFLGVAYDALRPPANAEAFPYAGMGLGRAF
jgi:hypothetical protein